MSPPLQAARIYTHHRHLLLLGPKADTHFTIPQRQITLLMLIGIFCHILLPCSWSNFAKNVISSSVGCSDYLPQTSSNFVQYSSEAKQKCRRQHGTTGHGENVIASAARSLHSKNIYQSLLTVALVI